MKKSKKAVDKGKKVWQNIIVVSEGERKAPGGQHHIKEKFEKNQKKILTNQK